MSISNIHGRIVASISLGLLLFSPLTYAQSRLQYSFVEVSYSQADIDEPVSGVGDLDADILGISVSVAINDQFFVQAGYANADFDDVAGITLEEDDVFAGVGWHTALNADTDFAITANYLYADAEACDFSMCISDDDSGFSVTAGIRSLISNDKVEFGIGLGYADIGDGSGDGSLSGSVRYHFTEAISAGLGIAFGNDATQYGIGLRFAW